MDIILFILSIHFFVFYMILLFVYMHHVIFHIYGYYILMMHIFDDQNLYEILCYFGFLSSLIMMNISSMNYFFLEL
jgi:hypothetical protein